VHRPRRRRLELITTCRDATSTHNIAIHAYVFMGNHLLLTSISDTSFPNHARHRQRCVPVFNLRHGCSGTHRQGHSKSCQVDAECHVLTVHCYIELNPVRVGGAKNGPSSTVDPVFTPTWELLREKAGHLQESHLPPAETRRQRLAQRVDEGGA
jgi:hypothetical protein